MKESFSNYEGLNPQTKTALYNLAKDSFNNFKTQALAVEGFNFESVNLHLNTLREGEKYLLALGILNAIKDHNNLSPEEESYVLDRLEFLCSGKIGEA